MPWHSEWGSNKRNFQIHWGTYLFKKRVYSHISSIRNMDRDNK